MKYLHFVADEKVLSALKASTPERLARLEQELGHPLPLALKEYLLLMGEQTCLHVEWDEYGTQGMAKLKAWLYEWIAEYRAKGMPLKAIGEVLPFLNFQDTTFYVPLDGREDPPVYAFDVNEKPTIRRVADSFSAYVRKAYERTRSARARQP